MCLSAFVVCCLLCVVVLVSCYCLLLFVVIVVVGCRCCGCYCCCYCLVLSFWQKRNLLSDAFVCLFFFGGLFKLFMAHSTFFAYLSTSVVIVVIVIIFIVVIDK